MSQIKCHVPFLKPASLSFSGNHITFYPVAQVRVFFQVFPDSTVLPMDSSTHSSPGSIFTRQSHVSPTRLSRSPLLCCTLLQSLHSSHGSDNAPFKVSCVPPSNILVPITCGQEPSHREDGLGALYHLFDLSSFLSNLLSSSPFLDHAWRCQFRVLS